MQKICVGAYFTAILDDMSNIYTFGLGDLGQLGILIHFSLTYSCMHAYIQHVLLSHYDNILIHENFFFVNLKIFFCYFRP